MQKLAAAVILYHPPEDVLQNILSYYYEVERLYVFDNTPQTQVAHWFTNLEKAVFIHDGENRGIAERLNTACKQALAEGFDWLLTMDQDTSFPPGAMDAYRHCFNQFPEKETVAAFGTTFERFAKASEPECSYRTNLFIITSGALINLPVYTKLGGFDEALFIDGVDHDYSLKANSAGYQVIELSSVILQHPIGEGVYRASFKSLYLKKKKVIVHSPLRSYYLWRNLLYLKKKYAAEYPEWVAGNEKSVREYLRTNVFYNRQALLTLWYILKAKRDFKNGKMGKIQ